MGKRILGWLRQRPVAVAYGSTWCLLVIAIVFFFWNTLMIISVQVDEKDVWPVWMIYCLPLLFLVGFIVARQIIYWRRKVWQQSRPILTMRLILIVAFVLFFQCALAVPNGIGLGFYIGKGDPEPGLVSTQEVIFIWVLFLVGALFQCILIEFENRRAEVDKVVGGILIIMGIMMPKLLESWTLLSAHCSIGNCAPDQFEVFVVFKMGIAYAVGLSVMFVVGLFSETIVQFIRSSEEELSVVSKESSLADSHNAEVPVSEREIATASDKQSGDVELAPGSSSAATCAPQETAGGVVPPVCSEETSDRPTVLLASSSVSRGDDEGLTRSMKSVMGPVDVSVPVESSSGSGSVAVSKRLMSAAVTGVVAGVCFSVASRLFSRR